MVKIITVNFQQDSKSDHYFSKLALNSLSYWGLRCRLNNFNFFLKTRFICTVGVKGANPPVLIQL